MAITYLGQQQFPATDDANITGTTVTLDKDVAPFNTLSANDFVLVLVQFKVAATTISVTTTGGQTWTEDQDAVSNGLNQALYRCFFNGTWDADPVFTNTGAASANQMWAVAFSGVNTTTPWDVAPAFNAQAASTTFVNATFNTLTDGALAIEGAGSADNNTWTVDNSFTAPSGSGNIYWRSSGSTDSSLVLITKAMPAAGAVGQTTITQATLGGDAGWRWHTGALKPAPATPSDAVRRMGRNAHVPLLDFDPWSMNRWR